MSIGQKLYEDIVIVVSDEKNNKKEVLGEVVLIPAVTDCQNVVNPMTDGPCECEPLVHGVSIKERNQGHPDDGSDDARVGVCVNSNGTKIKHGLQTAGKFLLVLGFLYFFICSLGLLGAAFQLLGGKTAGKVFEQSELLSNPVCGLMIGILATVLVQSSSTSTSIIVTMVASGIIGVRPAIPMIMGANIGTSVTNTVVSMAQVGDRNQFRRAFSAATVHDMFNWLSVIILLPLECATGYLEKLTGALTKSFKGSSFKGGKQDFLKVITKPLTKLIVELDKKILQKIAVGDKNYEDKSLIKRFCVKEADKGDWTYNVTATVNTTLNSTVNVTEQGGPRCASLFSILDLNDTVSGVILLIFSLVVLCCCLVGMVKVLNSMMKGPIAKALKNVVNADFPGCFKFLTGYVAMLVGAILTVLVQSSSVFTSTLTPLVGLGLIKVDRMYPLTLGSNIGTTMTSLLAAFAASENKLDEALQIALCHFFFNISGILIFYPVPVMRRVPIRAAKFLGKITSEYRWFAGMYIVLSFLLLPVMVFGLSMAGQIPFIVVGSIVLFIIFNVVVLNVLQSKKPTWLPARLRTWDFLPEFLHSLKPYDKVFTACSICFCTSCQKKDSVYNSLPLTESASSSPNSSSNSSRFPSTANSTVDLLQNRV
ncbi:NPT [Mytilus edulis]|uniref:SLC34A n=1 Tax=Mytilus edulis TaxID=6550 RepID=A0A8S3RYJ7_MYTED|nr:NPT [Mytilus edulis]